MKVRKKVKVFGRVQGVFFRLNTKRLADKLGVKGWVRNCEDGTVEAVFEGEKEQVEKIVKWCHRGPVAARVDKVEVIDEEFKNEFKSFEIIY